MSGKRISHRKSISLLVILVFFFGFLGVGKSFASDNTKVYKKIAKELLKGKEKEGKNKSIAVVDFTYSDGHPSWDGDIIADRLTTEIVRMKGFKIIERKDIEKVLKELKFQRSGLVDINSIKETGKMRGADWLVVGKLTKLSDDQIEINARVVVVESCEVISAASGVVKKDWVEEYKKIIEKQDTSIKERPNDAKLFYERGIANLDLKEYDMAIADFDIAIALDPDYKEAYLARGDAYYKKKEYDLAIQDYTKAIELDPKYAWAYNNRGAAYYYKGEYDLAIKDYNKAIELNPKFAGAYNNRGLAYKKIGEYDKANADFKKAEKLEKNNPQ